MKPDVLSPKERPQLNLNIFKNVRFLMVLAIIAVLSASCNPSNEEVSDNDEDLAGLPDDSGVPEYLIPVVEKRDTDMIICEEILVADAGVEVKTPIAETQLYRDVVKALEIKNNSGKRKKRKKRK